MDVRIASKPKGGQRPAARNHLVKTYGRRIDVGSMIQSLGSCLFGRHVGCLTPDIEKPRRIDGRLGDTEIRQLDLSRSRQQNVRWRHVSMHDF